MARQLGGGVTVSRTTRLCLRGAEQGEAPVLELRGEFDVATVPDIDRFLRRRLGPLYNREDLVIDLSGTTFVDSSFVTFLVGLVKALRAAGGELLLVRPAGQVRRVLALVGVPNLVPVFETVEDALRSLAAGPLPLIPPPFDPAMESRPEA
jgi:anti-sigma B factor antagonist